MHQGCNELLARLNRLILKDTNWNITFTTAADYTPR